MHNKENDQWFLTQVKEGVIEVSVDGKVFNKKTKRCIGAVGSGGYPKISLTSHKENRKWIIKHMQIHRLVWLLFKGTIPNNLEINHIDGDKKNPHLKNLELTSTKGNSKHAWESGLTVPKLGENNGMASFTDNEVVSYRKSVYDRTIKPKDIIAKTGVSKVSVYQMLNGKHYRHLPFAIKFRGNRPS